MLRLIKPKHLSAGIVLLFGAVLIVGRINNELRYKTSGLTTRATVTGVAFPSIRQKVPTVYVHIQFTDFTDASPGIASQPFWRDEWTPVPIGGHVPAVGDTIEVQYIPGISGESRLPSPPPPEIHLAPLLPMLVIFAIGTAWIIKKGRRDAEFLPTWNQHHKLRDTTSPGPPAKYPGQWLQ